MKTNDQELIDFYRKLIQTRSYSDEEENVVRLVEQTMKDLGYDEVKIDRTGNIIGRIGKGDRILHFDSHMDNVRVNDPEDWEVPPFSAGEKDGLIWGRGSVDMKGGLAASVFAGARAKEAGIPDDVSVMVTGTVCEEFCDGVNLEHLYDDLEKLPDVCVICEPSGNLITTGHTGKVQIRITTHGVSAHGSAPEKGVNAVYEMNPIIHDVEALNESLRENGGGTVVLSNISCKSASVNAVPSECEIYLDRRLREGETVGMVYAEMDRLVKDRPASWELGTIERTSWTGEPLVYKPAHDPWRIPDDHPVTKAMVRAAEKVPGVDSENFEFWDFSTNAVTPVTRGIDTIGFGPGAYKLAHMTNERCDPNEVVQAAKVYENFIEEFGRGL